MDTRICKRRVLGGQTAAHGPSGANLAIRSLLVEDPGALMQQYRLSALKTTNREFLAIA